MTDAAVLRAVIDGEPVPKGRPRFAVRKGKDGGAFAKTYTPAETRAYEDKIRLLVKIAANQAKWTWTKDDRFAVVIRIFRTHYDKGGDADNVAKAALDAMIGCAYPDDRYIRGLGIALCDPDPERPRLEIEVRRYSVTKPKRKKAA